MIPGVIGKKFFKMDFFVITGASKGIGRAIAEELAKDGKNLILLARSEDLLREIAEDYQKKYNITAHFLALDLLKPESMDRLIDFINNHHYQIEGLINNAGFGLFGRFDKLEFGIIQKMMSLNQMVIVRYSYGMIPLRNKHKKFYIMNIASTASFQPVPYFSIYAATKAFVLSFSRALKEELRKQNISVSCLCPGPTDTEFFNKAEANQGILNSDIIKMSPVTVARKGVKGMFNSEGIIIPGFHNKLNYFGSKLLPIRWIIKIVELILRPKN
jgi:uncharacterized protein